ncbi:MAG: hypothetical protein LBK94_00765 [Prevotellaceae bacterium]|jgi:hypothetical protein|nr:hypothetical protein [Prevotellaceae bacterium]
MKTRVICDIYYRNRLYRVGDTIDLSEEEISRLSAYGYVEPVKGEAKSGRKKSKKSED